MSSTIDNIACPSTFEGICDANLQVQKNIHEFTSSDDKNEFTISNANY